MPVPDAIAVFRSAAIAKGDIASPRSLDIAFLERLADAFAELDAIGLEGRSALKNLLQDRSPYVRRWVAHQLLSEGDAAALPVLQQLAAEPTPLGLTVEKILADHAAGRLTSPFECDP